MSRRPRRNHASAFKAKVAIAAIKGDRTLVQLPHRRRNGSATLTFVGGHRRRRRTAVRFKCGSGAPS